MIPLHEGEDKVTEEYPGFVVHDERVSGSITFGHSRLPLWAVIQGMIEEGYKAAVENYPTVPEYVTDVQIGLFLQDLLEHRREFARLLCVLADVQRRERERRWREYGPNAVYQIGGGSQVRSDLEATFDDMGLGPIIPVDPHSAPPALRPWYADAENIKRVRAALHNCVKELDRLEAKI